MLKLIIGIIFVSILFISFYNPQYKEHLSSNDDCPPPIKLTGKQGPQGPPGLSGGIFQKTGPLRNLNNNNMVVDRLAGNGPSSVPYLADMNYTTHQTWTLESDKIKNSYGGCLYGDNTTNIIYINDCDKSEPTGIEWLYDNIGRLKLKNIPTKCAVPVYEGIVQDVKSKQNLNFNDTTIKNNVSKFLQLKLTDCDETLNQQWSFY